MVAKFIDRSSELEALQRILESPRFELAIIYGRRRVGKTRLVLQALKGKRYIYYLAVESGNLERFRRTASKLIPELRYVREDWEAYFHFLKDWVVVIDEFPNLIAEDKTVVSLFQKIVDTVLHGTKTKLLLVGSSVSMMKNAVLSYKSPLYGRRTAQLKIGPLPFTALREFFPSASPRELVEIYGFADGIPYYLEKVETPFWEWLDRELRDPKSFLRYEGDFLLRYEFEDTGTYKRILEAIASGKTRLGEIKGFVGKSSITEYLKNLMEVELVEHVKPVTGGRRGVYRIKDNFTRFWFRYIYPYLSEIELGIYGAEDVKKSYDDYLGMTYEKIALQFIAQLIRRGELPAVKKLGPWWSKGEEIDIVGLNGRKTGIFVEVKWSSLSPRKLERIYESLVANASHIDVDERIYVVVCRSYTGPVPPGLRVYTLQDILRGGG